MSIRYWPICIRARSDWVGRPVGLTCAAAAACASRGNFRIVFVICEECRRVPECRFCFCEGLSDETVVFLTVGPHDRAYAMGEEAMEYAVVQESTEEKAK